MWYGERLEEHADIDSGDFIYIPAGIPHLPYNPSKTETCTAVVARTDPNEQESVKLLPRTGRDTQLDKESMYPPWTIRKLT